MVPERIVKTTLIIDEHGAVKAVHGVGEESARTEHKLGQLDKSVKGLGHSFKGLKGLLMGGVGLLGAGSALYGIKGVVDSTKEALLQTEKFSAISGTSAQQSLYLNAALKARGINTEAAGKAFAFLGSNIKTAERQEHGFAVAQEKAGAKGKITTSLLGKQAEAFRQLFGGRGVSVLAGLSGEQKLAKVVQAFEKLPESIKKTGAQAALMKEVFGRGGLSLATVLEGGSTGLTHFTEVAKKFFPTIKGGQRGLEEWQTKNSEFHLGLEGLEFSLGMKLIPILMGVEEWFTKVSLEIKAGKGTWGELAKAVEGVVGFLKGLWRTFEGIVGPTDAVKVAVSGLVGVMVIGKVSAFAGALTGLGAAGGGALATINPLLAAMAALAALTLEGGKHPFNAWEEAFHSIVGGYTAEEKERKAKEKKEQQRFLASPAHRSDLQRRGEHLMRVAAPEVRDPHLRAQVERYEGKRIHGIELEAIKAELHVDSVKVAEAMIHNPRSRRKVAEAVAVYAQQMTARK